MNLPRFGGIEGRNFRGFVRYPMVLPRRGHSQPVGFRALAASNGPVCASIVQPSQRARSVGWRRTAGPRGVDQRGFTLLELLVVLAILGLLIGLVAPAALRQLGSAKVKVAHQSIERLASVLDIYKLDVGTYPTTEQGLQALLVKPSGVEHWSGPYLKGEAVPEDPWGRPFVYRMPSDRQGHDYDLYSLGPDGKLAGTDQSDKTLSN